MRTDNTPRPLLYLLVVMGGMAALSWEVLWQLHASLVLGVSAMGTAITLAALMGGMTLGALSVGRLLRGHTLSNPLRTYGWIELCIGVSGLLLGPGFRLVEALDTDVYAAVPTGAPLVHLIGIVVVLGVPSLAMGASIPVFGLVARQHHTSIAALYGFNILGAAVGCLATAFIILPAIGTAKTALVLALVNIAIFAVSRVLPSPAASAAAPSADSPASVGRIDPRMAGLVVFVSGFATFTLEVAWFRAYRSAFYSTTTTFALMLAAVLVPLAFAAARARRLKGTRHDLGDILVTAGVLVLVSTPVVERVDLVASVFFVSILASRFVFVLAAIGPAVLFLGMALPLLLEGQRDEAGWARLYAINTVGAIVGSLGAAWVLLPALGFARTAWAVGGAVLVLGLWNARGNQLSFRLAVGVASLAVAIGFESGVGRHRLIGSDTEAFTLVDFKDGPDYTVAVVEDEAGVRSLYIDGFQATTEASQAHYMAWMGRLPMLLHSNPTDALVICFGTGQTANAVRQEGVHALDIVDISSIVFGMSKYFHANERVLDDPRVTTVTMDGRAWLRRTDRTYDVLTLEPMPPTFAGVNALYSHEFYELAAGRLKPGGVVAQWLPFHLLSEYRAKAVAATFLTTFPNAVLWVDPVNRTGILLGTDGDGDLGSQWPGLERGARGRNMTASEVRRQVVLDRDALRAYSAGGEIITDDNQLLAYGFGVEADLFNHSAYNDLNHDSVLAFAGRTR